MGITLRHASLLALIEFETQARATTDGGEFPVGPTHARAFHHTVALGEVHRIGCSYDRIPSDAAHSWGEPRRVEVHSDSSSNVRTAQQRPYRGRLGERAEAVVPHRNYPKQDIIAETDD
jgi:hypothetical protein